MYRNLFRRKCSHKNNALPEFSEDFSKSRRGFVFLRNLY